MILYIVWILPLMDAWGFFWSCFGYPVVKRVRSGVGEKRMGLVNGEGESDLLKHSNIE